jgi:site-specific recombinase XerD
LSWYEQEEREPLQLAALTPIALIGYRNFLQHEQHKSISTINLRISALRAWCAWLVDQSYLPLDPAARVKLIGGEAGSKREGLESSQVNALRASHWRSLGEQLPPSIGRSSRRRKHEGGKYPVTVPSNALCSRLILL